MNEYIEITSLPIGRDVSSLLSPVALLAARLTDNGTTLELRVHNEEDRIHCYVGIDSILLATQLKNILSDLNCGNKYTSHHEFSSYGTLLVRKIIETYNRVPNNNVNRGMQIKEISVDKNRMRALYSTLSRLPKGCGYSILIRRTSQQDVTALKDMMNQNHTDSDNIYAKLCKTLDLYQACICVFGDSYDNRLLLQSELQFAFDGFQAITNNELDISAKNVWDYLAQYHPNIAACRAPWILSSFLFSEINNCFDISCLNQVQRGIPTNKDSLFPKQLNRLYSTNHYISLGFNENGDEQIIPLRMLRQHMFISGAPGTGKGNLIFSLANQLYKLKIPVLLIESAKQEQHHLRKTIPQLRVWRPKAGEYLLNPFSLPPDITMGDYRSSLLQILKTCFKGGGSESALDELYATTLNRCLAKYGYTENSTNNTPGVIPFGLSEFIMEYIRLLETNGYSDRVRNDMRTAGVTRMRALFDQNPDVFDTVNSVPVSELANGFNLLQLNTLTTLESKQLFATILLISLGAWLRLNGKGSDELQLVVIMDESHNLLKGVDNIRDTTYSFSEDFQNLLLEMRSLGVSFIVADQSATNLPKMISEVCATKVFLGSSRFSGVDLYSDLFKADDHTLNNLYMLKAGEGIWNTYGMSSGAFFSSHDVIRGYHVNESYPVSNNYILTRKDFFCHTFSECTHCPGKNTCNIMQKQHARRFTAILIDNYRVKLQNNLIFKIPDNMSEQSIREEKNKYIRRLNNLLYKIASDIVNSNNNEAAYCCVIQFIRQYNREATIPLTHDYINGLLGFVQKLLQK